MAISKGNKTEEVKEFDRYIGVSSMFVKSVNPNKKEYETLFGTELEENPVYVTDEEDSNGNPYKRARVQVVFQMAKDKYSSDSELLADFNDPEGVKISMALFIQNKPRVGAASGKTQVIDKYGRTAWATEEELNSHSPIMYKNGPADIDKDYRPAYVGEEELTAFVKAYLGIPDVTVWDDNLKKRVPNPKVKPEECECRFDNLDNIFKGDFSEIVDAIGLMPINRVKVLLGVRTDVETGRLFQAVYTKKFLSNRTRNYNSLDKEIQEMINNANENGRTLNTEYEVAPVHVYSVEATTISPSEAPAPSSDMPFDESEGDAPWK